MIARSKSMSLELYEDLLNLAREQANVDLLIKIWYDSIRMNREAMIQINNTIVSFLPYLRKRLGMPPSKSKDFRKFVEKYDEQEYLKNCTDTSDSCLVFFSKMGDLKNVKRAIRKGATNLNSALMAATSHNQKKVVDYLVEKVEDNPDERERNHSWTVALGGAVKGGHVDLIEFFLEKGAVKTPIMYELAARQGSPEVLKFFDYNTRRKQKDGLLGAARGGHLELVKDFFSMLDNVDPNKAFVEAAKGGHIEVMDYLLDKGAFLLSVAIEKAAQKGQLSSVKYILEKDSTLTQNAMTAAIASNNLHVIQYLVEEKDFGVSQALRKALYNPDTKVVIYLVTKLLESDEDPRRINSLLTYTVETVAEKEKQEILEYLLDVLRPSKILENNKTVLDYALLGAARADNLELFRTLLERKGRTLTFNKLLKSSGRQVTNYLLDKVEDLNKALLTLVETGFLSDVKRVVDMGATNIREAVELAELSDDDYTLEEILPYLQEVLDN